MISWSAEYFWLIPLIPLAASLLILSLASKRRAAAFALALAPARRTREFDLLAYLVRQHGQIVTREMLAREVWREENRATPLDNVIDVHAKGLASSSDGQDRAIVGIGRVLRVKHLQSQGRDF